MTIGNLDLNNGLHPSDSLHQKQTEKLNELDARGTKRSEFESDAAPTHDTLDISEAGRRALEEDQRRSRELADAQHALHSHPGIDSGRLAEIKQRLTSNFYTRPDVIDEVARRMGEELRGTSGPA